MAAGFFQLVMLNQTLPLNPSAFREASGCEMVKGTIAKVKKFEKAHDVGRHTSARWWHVRWAYPRHCPLGCSGNIYFAPPTCTSYYEAKRSFSPLRSIAFCLRHNPVPSRKHVRPSLSILLSPTTKELHYAFFTYLISFPFFYLNTLVASQGTLFVSFATELALPLNRGLCFLPSAPPE